MSKSAKREPNATLKEQEGDTGNNSSRVSMQKDRGFLSLGKPTSIWMDTTEKTGYPSLSQDAEADVAIVGGGIAGLMCGYFLKEKGQKVVILEAGRIAEGTTGFTTAKITSAHDIIYKYLNDKFGFRKAKFYADANETAKETIIKITKELSIDCDLKRKPAYTYTTSPDGVKKIEKEVVAAKALGLAVSLVKNSSLPYPIKAAIRYENQAQFHPRKFLLKIASVINDKESRIFENTRVLKIKEEKDYCVAITKNGTVKAKKLIQTTNFPVFDPTAFFARLVAIQSLVLGAKIEGPLPDGMFISIEPFFHSLRTQAWRGEELLLIGGGDYKTGNIKDVSEKYLELEKWARDNFPIKSIEYHWTTNDSESYDSVPIIGKLTPKSKNLYIATGFRGWGMTHGVVAGLILSDEIRGIRHPWSVLYSPHRFSSFLTYRGTKENVKTLSTLFKGKLFKSRQKLEDIKNGEGKVININGDKVAVSKNKDGRMTAISAVCTHMGCTVNWNNAEKTWDCPCHGSRYKSTGEVIHGPAIKNLKKKEIT